MKIFPRKDISALLPQDLELRFPGAVRGVSRSCGQFSLLVETARLAEVARYLKEDPPWQFNFLASVSGVDWMTRAPRFEVVYHLRSLVFNYLVGLKVDVPDDSLAVPSLCAVWNTANWHEREVFDLYGIRFAGHPDLRRIMMPEDWEGHPYRKDYPLAGRDAS